MRINNFLFFIFIGTFLFANAITGQTINFDETWKEFLLNNKISNMSALVKPDKAYKKQDYAKYLLMNTNSGFCQSDIEEAEKLIAEIQTLDNQVYSSIPGYVAKLSDIEAKIKIYYSIDVIWKKFLNTKEVDPDELEAVKSAKTVCEKQTLAKFSYMDAHYHFCQGNIPRSKKIFETRTLRLAEKTSLRVQDVEGLAQEVRKMKALYTDMEKLDAAWASYLETGESPGFDIELPLFPCNPIPNMKALVLMGTADLCEAGTEKLDKIRELEKETGISPMGELKKQVKVLENSLKKQQESVVILDKAWAAFIPNNEVKNMGDYGYEFCDKEDLIKAYIMDGFSFVCDMAEEALEKIDALQKQEDLDLEKITMTKINELGDLFEMYQANGRDVEETWNKFIAQGDTLMYEFPTTDMYCDNIQQVKDWTINGYCGTCEEKNTYLEAIESFQETFEFSFTEQLECRVQNLRVKLWDCRYDILKNLAEMDVSDASYEERLETLVVEYEMGDRPEECFSGS